MEKNHTPWKQRISRLLRSSSCGSCKSRTTSDVVARPETHHYQSIERLSPNPQYPFPSICTPKTELFSIPKVPYPSPLLTPLYTHGRNCPPASPISPLFTFPEFEKPQSKPKRKKLKKRRNRTTRLSKRGNNSDNYYDDDSEVEDDDHDEKTTLFSSVFSLSSDYSSDSFERNRANREANWPMGRESEVGLVPLQGKVKDSFVVKKRSSDPHDDFRNSMVEMIVERQIFGARDLEDLLQTFLSLNSYHHHGVIVQVYTEIWGALFSTNMC